MGGLEPLEVVLPPLFKLARTRAPPAAVAGGNVETSQFNKVSDACNGALGSSRRHPSYPLQPTFWDAHLQYYETIAGGAGAGVDFYCLRRRSDSHDQSPSPYAGDPRERGFHGAGRGSSRSAAARVRRRHTAATASVRRLVFRAAKSPDAPCRQSTSACAFGLQLGIRVSAVGAPTPRRRGV